MANFKSIITDTGTNLITKALAEGGTVVVNAVKFGDYKYSTLPVDPGKITQIANEITVDVKIASVEFVEAQDPSPAYMNTTLRLTNKGIVAPTYYREIGLFVDNNLFAYAYLSDTDDTDNILPPNDATDDFPSSEHTFNLITITTNQQNAVIEVVFNPGDYVTHSQLSAHEVDPKTHNNLPYVPIAGGVTMTGSLGVPMLDEVPNNTLVPNIGWLKEYGVVVQDQIINGRNPREGYDYTDFNQVVNPGIYRTIPGNPVEGLPTLPNSPEGKDIWGHIVVFPSATATQITQLIFDTSANAPSYTNQLYLRSGTTDGTSWTFQPWAAMATTDNLALKANLGSPAFSGIPTVPNPAVEDISGQIPNTWWVRHAINTFAPSGITNQFLTETGYVVFSNGFIIQWGFGTTDGDGKLLVTFPTAFPNKCVNVNVTCSQSWVWERWFSVFGVGNLTNGNMVVYSRIQSGGTTVVSSTTTYESHNFTYLAIGY